MANGCSLRVSCGRVPWGLQDNFAALQKAMACLLMLQPPASKVRSAPKFLSKLTICVWVLADTVQQRKALQYPASQIVISCCRGAGKCCRQEALKASNGQDAEQHSDILSPSGCST